MAETVILTFGSHFAITKPQTKIDYVLKMYALSPRSMSNTHYANAISLGERIASYGDDMTQITVPVEKDLHAELTRVFPDATEIDVDVTTEARDARNYSLIIKPTVTINGLTYSVSRALSVVDGVLITENETIPA